MVETSRQTDMATATDGSGRRGRAAKRAVFTTIGVVSSIGSDVSMFWQSLIGGKCGIRRMQNVPSDVPCQIAAEIPDFDARNWLEKKQHKGLRMMSRTVQMGVAAAQYAMDNSGLSKGQLDPTRFGIEFGAGMIVTDLDDLSRASKTSCTGQPPQVDFALWGQTGLKEIPPLWMLKYLPNMPACHISILHDAQGPNNTITASELAATLAVGEAYRILNRDLADFFLTGGTDSKNFFSHARHMLFQPLSRQNATPEKALRPFDRNRDGTVFGEGSTVLGLEELGHARRRGATIHAELVGFSSGFDRGLTGSGFARVISQAIADAGATPDQIDHVNAHGHGSIHLDQWEARAIHEAFSSVRAIPVWAPSSCFGNMSAASGTTELLASILALKNGLMPGTINHQTVDPTCPVSVHTGEPRKVTKPFAVKLSFTEMGQCAALVIRRFDEN